MPTQVARHSRKPRAARAAGAFALVVALAATAGPAEDMQLGEASFREGDLVTAIARFRQAAEAGHAPAQVRLADMLDHAESNEEAVDWYRKAAAQGSADGAYGLGHLLSIGEGVAQDNAEAVRWFTVAADAGHHGATWVLVSAFESGTLGLTADPARALALLRAAAERPGGEWAIARLARAYKQGELGLSPDAAQAAALESRLPAGATSTTPAPDPDDYY